MTVKEVIAQFKTTRELADGYMSTLGAEEAIRSYAQEVERETREQCAKICEDDNNENRSKPLANAIRQLPSLIR